MLARTRWGRRFGAWLGVAALACGAANGGARASAEPVIHRGQFPVTFDVGTAIIPFFFPEQAPPGANDPGCVLTPDRPRPVILINGTGVNQAANWQVGAPLLRNNGYCVFTFNYGNPTWISEIPVQAITDIRDGARQLAAEVDKVRALTGAGKVDLVGASQGGGVLPNYYINIAGGDRYVNTLIGLAPSNHGTTANGQVFLRKSFPPLGGVPFALLDALLPATTQQMIGSELMAQTYGQGDTRPGVTYTTLVTRYDEVVTPYTNQFLDGPNVSNIVLQDGCPDDYSDHLSINYSERAWRLVLNALDPEHATPVPCIPQGFLFPGIN
ncbi:esterase/lipase family protein [Nocardia yunnanensis]|uniref:esterase/lipase family protein n=1 Tax=Nocardia yunnanensis TaxID=2382165 RepID=UPI001FE96F76|nr:alpha/beta fold hydrolase [Nocardia yunnanensis]